VSGTSDTVGPVLQTGTLAEAVIAAIRDENPDVQTVDRGAYVRVLVPGCCRVTRAAIERHARRPFRLPGDLEKIMPAFKGRFHVNADGARWELRPRGAST